MPRLTLEDIAEKAGVSRSTVSRVINNHPNVSEKVRKLVREVIGDTGYTPNAAARTLASHRSGMIGLIYPKSVSSVFADPYYPRLTQGIVSACNQKNYTLNLFMAENRDEEDNIFVRALRTGFLDGMLIETGQIEDNIIERLRHSDIPLVVMGRPYHSEKVSYVDVDNVNAARIAVNHLISLGYQRIGTVTGPMDLVVGIDRLEGYLAALKENDIPVDESLIVNAHFGEEFGYHAMQKMLPAKPRAVFAASDMLALGAMRAVTDAGLRIPEDIAFVGFDDLPQLNNPFPPLTTIRQPIYGMGIQLVEMLLEIIDENSTEARNFIMETKLIVRQSCGALNKNKNTVGNSQ